jgi:hypothetical protein
MRKKLINWKNLENVQVLFTSLIFLEREEERSQVEDELQKTKIQLEEYKRARKKGAVDPRLEQLQVILRRLFNLL